MIDVRLMSSEKAARYLSISRPQLYTLDIPFVMIGRHRKYDVHDLDAYVDRLRAEATHKPRRPAA